MFRNTSGLGNYSRSTVDMLAKYYPENEYLLFVPTDGNRVGYEIPRGAEVVTPSGGPARQFPSLWRSFFMSGDIRNQRPDIYHGLSNELPADIRKSAAKSIVTIHDLIYVRYPGLYTAIDRFLYTKKYRGSCEKADMIIAISKQTRDDLIDFWNIPEERISVVYQGCNPMFYEKKTEEEKAAIRKKYGLPDEYILSVGTIEERKNLLLTVRAMVEGKIDMPLVVCGKSTPYLAAVMEYAGNKGIRDRLLIRHNITFPDLPAIYQMARVAVYASLFEGFGIPILEALNSGTPMITSKGGVFPEAGGDACLYVDPSDTEEMIAALDAVLNDSGMRAGMIRRGYDYALNFREDIVASKIMEVYRKIL